MTTKHQSSLMEEVSKAQETLHCLFDEIGLTRYDREGRQASLFAALNTALQDQMRSVIAEKNTLVEECNKVISSIKQMEKSLDDKTKKSREELKITAPLLRCLEALRGKQENVKARHAERYNAIRELARSVEEYADRLESGITQVPLPPATNDSSSIASFDLSHAYYERLENERSRLRKEYTKRLANVTSLAKDIINLYAELGATGSGVDKTIIEFGATNPEKLGLKLDNLNDLIGKKERLVKEKEKRKEKIEDLKQEIGQLWEKLGEEPSEGKRFLAQNRGIGLKVIRELEAELDRLLELKRQNLQLFVEDARQVLQDLWDKLYFSDDEIMHFQPAIADVYTDALLTSHEMEIRRLQLLLEERAPIISLIDKHRSLVNDREQLAISASDSSRLVSRGGSGNRDPTRLLREEKMRKRIAKELPKVEVELKKILEDWEKECGEPFLVNGDTYLQTLIRESPVLQSRAGSKGPAPAQATVKAGKWNPPATGSIQRVRSNTAGSGQPRPPSRPKTPSGPPMRSKTPTGGSTLVSASVGRSGGRSVAASLSRSNSVRTPATSARLPIPHTTASSTSTTSSNASSGSRTPTRLRAPASLSSFPDATSSDKSTTRLVRSQSVKQLERTGLSNTLGTAPRMGQLLPSQTMGPPQLPPYLRQQREKDHERERERGRELQRPSSTSRTMSREGTVMSVRSVSPESQFGGSDDNEDQRDYCEGTPRQNGYPKPPVKSLGYHESSSSNGDAESTRMFSGSSTGTTATSASSNENWQTFGDESEEEGSIGGGNGGGYYRRGYAGYPSKRVGGGGGVVMVRNEEDEAEEWEEGEAAGRY
ncbi:unnamed protein product [Tuber melanosporum]|uniref:(Perigord truffle) hypothetical protein n=1 Tax=Tuber melanosporum (strain Mel28) TaxID=656061 RepID=D5GBZ2_TUBMM|nr:uncharacterized protein GSTUM_00005718001 [Tuber melanosporum]CAZ82035.1 unnamed protein product [Tuber melanosporum]